MWSWKKSLGFGEFGLKKNIGFGKFSLGRKVSVSVSENLVSEKKSRYRFRSKFWYRHSVISTHLNSTQLNSTQVNPVKAEVTA